VSKRVCKRSKLCQRLLPNRPETPSLRVRAFGVCLPVMRLGDVMRRPLVPRKANYRSPMRGDLREPIPGRKASVVTKTLTARR